MADDTIEERIVRIQQHADKMGHDEGADATTSEQLRALYERSPEKAEIMLMLFEFTAAEEQRTGKVLYA